ncbi:MAG TPA: aspartate-alanine antiporter [Planctomycetota bacterium]
MAWLQQLFQKSPELAVYLALGLGYWVGGLKFRGFSLGGSTGSLLAGLLIGGLLEVPVSSAAKSVLFMLFLFGIGYSVGPKFAKAMKGDGWRFAVLGVFVPVVGLATAWVVARVLGLDPGFAGGLVSGALTESPAIGTASEAIQALGLAPEVTEKLVGHVAVGDALCYVFGAFGVIWFCGTLGPRLLGLDLVAEARKLEEQYGIDRTQPGVASGWRRFELRAFRLGDTSSFRRASELEASVGGARLFVVRLRRAGEVLEGAPDLALQPGDVVALSGPREALVAHPAPGLEEVEDRELLDLPVAFREVFLTSADFDGATLEEIAARASEVRGVYLRRILRGEQEIPIGPRTVLERGDVVRLVGPEAAVTRVAARIGATIQSTDTTDFRVLGIGVVVGAVVGIVCGFDLEGFKLSLGSSVGVLLAGIAVGWLRGRRPLFGRIPDAAVSFMQSLGLSAFVAMVGLGAGPHFVPAVREAGLGLFLGGIVVTMVPLFAGLYFGIHVLKANPLLLLGGLSGAQTFTPGLAAVQEKSGSPIAVLGYSGSVAIAHVLLPMWGSIIVYLVAPGGTPPG